MNPNSLKILALFYSRRGSTFNLAHQIARGIEGMSGCGAVVRTAFGVSAVYEAVEKGVLDSGTPYVTTEDFKTCSGLVLDSPPHFDNMTVAVKYFIDGMTPQWLGTEPVGKPATVFTSTDNLYGRQESILPATMLPLLHHGMTISDIPFGEYALNHIQSGGTPYDAPHVTGYDGKTVFTPDEHEIAFTQGKRLAELVVKPAG